MKSIEELSIVALGQRLQTVFSLTTQPIECPTGDIVHLLQRRKNLKGEALEYPILAYSLSTIQPSDTVNPSVAMFMAVRTASRADTIGGMTAIPVHLVFEVNYVDNDRVRTLMFLSQWVRASASGLLNFRLRVDGAPVDIQVSPDTSITVPQKDTSADITNQYEFQSNINMRSYLTGPFTSSIKRITAIKDVVFGFHLPPSAGSQASAWLDTSDYAEGSKVSHEGSVYKANGYIPVGVPFSVGLGPTDWSPVGMPMDLGEGKGITADYYVDKLANYTEKDASDKNLAFEVVVHK